MNHIALQNINIDVCTKCKGVWLDDGELRSLISYFSSGELGDKFNHWKEVHTTGKTLPRDFWNEGKLQCPNDSDLLTKHYFAGDSGIGIENCRRCNGFWIDGDEMLALAEYNKPNINLDLAVKYLIEEDNSFRKELQEIAALPQTLHNMATSAPYAIYILFRYVVMLIIEELEEDAKAKI